MLGFFRRKAAKWNQDGAAKKQDDRRKSESDQSHQGGGAEHCAKSGVQSLLDIMAGGRGKAKQRSRNKTGGDHNGRSWSFHGQKSKPDLEALGGGGLVRSASDDTAGLQDIDLHQEEPARGEGDRGGVTSQLGTAASSGADEAEAEDPPAQSAAKCDTSRTNRDPVPENCNHTGDNRKTRDRNPEIVPECALPQIDGGVSATTGADEATRQMGAADSRLDQSRKPPADDRSGQHQHLPDVSGPEPPDVPARRAKIRDELPDVTGDNGKTLARERGEKIAAADTEKMNGLVGGEKTLKNILKDFSELGRRDEAGKKRVTFHSVIAFDDGDKVCDGEALEEDSALDSFASFDEDDEGVEFELPDLLPGVRRRETTPGEIETLGREIVDFKSVDFSDDESDSEKCKNGTQTKDSGFHDAEGGMQVIEVENNENLGSDDVDETDFDVIVTEFSEEDNSLDDSKIGKQENAFKIVEIDDEEEEVFEESYEEEVEVEKRVVEEVIPIGVSEVKVNAEAEKISVPEEEESVEEEDSSEEDAESDCSESGDDEDDDEDEEEVEEERDFRKVDRDVCDCEKTPARPPPSWRQEEKETEEDSAYADLLRVVEKQLRGLADQDGKLGDFQERAVALNRVQAEVRSAHKEADMIRQRLLNVEADQAATRNRNCSLLEQIDQQSVSVRAAEQHARQLALEVASLQERLDSTVPEAQRLQHLADQLRQERDQERENFNKTLAEERAARAADDAARRQEFEKLRSQGAESEEMLLADCEWKLRDVQRAARERAEKAEQRHAEAQRQADERLAQAQRQLAQVKLAEEELVEARARAHEQARLLRGSSAQLAAAQAAHAASSQDATRLRALLDQHKDQLVTLRVQHIKDLEEKEQRLVTRLAEQARRLEAEARSQSETRTAACRQHEAALREATKKVETLKASLSEKETRFREEMERTKGRADWQLLEMRRQLDKVEAKYQEAVEQLEEEHAKDTERLAEEGDKRVRELEAELNAQACSARATLELVRGQLHAEHADALHRLKDAHRQEMEQQWEMFTTDKEQCLERMKAECVQEGEEEREKREKQMLHDLEELKSELSAKDNAVSSLRIEARKATDARTDVERRLSEVTTAVVTREQVVRGEAARAAEVAQRESRETIDHLTKKCVCLTNLFEDMRTRWQQAPGEAAQLRRALQDERARAAALRRQLEAMSRVGGGEAVKEESKPEQVQAEATAVINVSVAASSVMQSVMNKINESNKSLQQKKSLIQSKWEKQTQKLDVTPKPVSNVKTHIPILMRSEGRPLSPKAENSQSLPSLSDQGHKKSKLPVKINPTPKLLTVATGKVDSLMPTSSGVDKQKADTSSLLDNNTPSDDAGKSQPASSDETQPPQEEEQLDYRWFGRAMLGRRRPVRMLSPPRVVDLPAVTVPVRIRQFNSRYRSKGSP